MVICLEARTTSKSSSAGSWGGDLGRCECAWGSAWGAGTVGVWGTVSNHTLAQEQAMARCRCHLARLSTLVQRLHVHAAPPSACSARIGMQHPHRHAASTSCGRVHPPCSHHLSAALPVLTGWAATRRLQPDGPPLIHLTLSLLAEKPASYSLQEGVSTAPVGTPAGSGAGEGGGSVYEGRRAGEGGGR